MIVKATKYADARDDGYIETYRKYYKDREGLTLYEACNFRSSSDFSDDIKERVSHDNGKTWSAPISTGIRGQASSVCALGGEKLLALHAIRRDTDRPGIYAYVIDFSDKTWKIVDEMVVWEPANPVLKDTKMAEIFAFLKFGQPSAIKLQDGDLLMTHWYAQDGLYRTVTTRIEL